MSGYTSTQKDSKEQVVIKVQEENVQNVQTVHASKKRKRHIIKRKISKQLKSSRTM